MQMKEDLISVIVRTKDRPELSKKALQSIESQTYRPIEVVLVNDGGCDLDISEMKNILGDVSLNYIKLEVNKGRAYAGNTGIKNAGGKYVGFLDDDDRFSENHLSVLVPFLEKSGAGVVYSDAAVVYGSDEIKNVCEPDTPVRVFSSYDFSYNDLLTENYIPLICILFKRELLEESGGFDETFDLYEDWDLLLRLGKDYHFEHINTVTAQYNIWNPSEQIANVEGKEHIRLKAYENIFYMTFGH